MISATRANPLTCFEALAGCCTLTGAASYVVVRGAFLEASALQEINHRAPVGDSRLQQIQAGKSRQREPPGRMQRGQNGTARHHHSRSCPQTSFDCHRRDPHSERLDLERNFVFGIVLPRIDSRQARLVTNIATEGAKALSRPNPRIVSGKSLAADEVQNRRLASCRTSLRRLKSAAGS